MILLVTSFLALISTVPAGPNMGNSFGSGDLFGARNSFRYSITLGNDNTFHSFISTSSGNQFGSNITIGNSATF